MKNRSLCAFLLTLCAAPPVVGEERELSEVVVNAKSSAMEEQQANVTQKIVLDRKAIEDTGGLTVGEVLGKLPGIEGGVSGSDGSVSLRSRGMVRDSVQLLIDGERPANNSRHTMLIISRMPAGELERVEIMRGASAEFGNAAPVTINLVTSKSKRESGIKYKLGAGYKANEWVPSLSLTKEGKSGAWSWTLPLSFSDHRNPVDKTLVRQKSAGGVRTLWQNETQKSRGSFPGVYFAPKLNWKEGKSSFSVWPTFYRARGKSDTDIERTQYADPVGGTGLSTVLTRHDHEDVHLAINRLRLEGETFTGGSKLSGRLTMMDGKRDTDTVRNGSSGTDYESMRRDESEINGAIRLDRGVGRHMISSSFEYVGLEREETQDYTGMYVDHGTYTADEQQRTLWLQDEWAVADSVTLTGGLRGESIALRSDSVSHTFGAVSPSLAARWEAVEGWVLRSSLGAAVKAPKLDEISNAPIRATSSNTPLEPDRRGNADLQPERSVNLEAGVEHYWPNKAAVAGINFYYRQTRHFIERRTVLESARWVERPYNEGDARHWGVELDSQVKSAAVLPKDGSVRAHLTLPFARVDDERLGITRNARELPRYIFSLGYDQSLPALSSSAGFMLQRSGDTRTDVSGEQWTKTEGRTVLDAYWVRKLDRTTNLRFTFQNILGEDLTKTQRAWSGGQEWQLGTTEGQPRAFLVTLEGKL